MEVHPQVQRLPGGNGGLGSSPSCLHTGPSHTHAASLERCPRWSPLPRCLPAPWQNKPPTASLCSNGFLLQMVPSDPTSSPCQAFKVLTLCNQPNLVTIIIIKLTAIFHISSYKLIVHMGFHLIKMISIDRGLLWISERSSDLLKATQLPS